MEDLPVSLIIQQAESLNGNLWRLQGSSREMARLERDRLLEELREKCQSNWFNKVRLTIMDSNRRYHNEKIKFANPDGSIAIVDDLAMATHVLVTPENDNFTADSIAENPGLVKLDQEEVEWMPIDSHLKFLVIRFATGRLYLISNSFGIRAMAPPEYVDNANAGY